MVTKLCTPSHFASDVDTITICLREREPISGWYEDVNGKNATCSLPISSLYWVDRQTYDNENPRRELYLAITEELYLAETRASSRKLQETRVSQTEELTLKDETWSRRRDDYLIAKTRWDLCLKIREPCLAITGEPVSQWEGGSFPKRVLGGSTRKPRILLITYRRSLIT